MSRGRRKWATDDGWAEHGGYMAAKKRKLDEQFKEDAPKQIERQGSSSKIFEGVRIYINGYTVPSSDELKRLMMLHGGQHNYYYSKTKVTHVIATALPHGKIRELKGEKVVKPEWILDSIKAGRLLSCTPYLLYSQQSKSQPGLPFGRAMKREDSNQGDSLDADSNETTANHMSDSEHVANQTAEAEENSAIQSERSVKSSKAGESVDSKDETTFQGLSKNLEIEIPDHGDQAKKEETEKASTSSLQSPGQQVKVKEQRLPSKAGEPNFVSEFYSNSRLHHISTWGAEYKAFVNRLQSEGDTTFPGREKLRKLHAERMLTADTDHATMGKPCAEGQRVIMHVDMDCFFVSVGLLGRPELKGKPVAVTHSKGKSAHTDRPNADPEYERDYYHRVRLEKSLKGKSVPKAQGKSESSDVAPTAETASSTVRKTDSRKTTEEYNSMAEIASCSYEARRAGLKNGMFMGQAKKLCPDLQTIPYDFDKYKEISQILYETVASYTHDIEAVSCDEMLVDISEILQDTGVTSLQFSDILRHEIYQKTGCRASVGLAANILLARMATRVAKPNGQFYLEPDNVAEFIKTQLVKDLPGVGWSLGHRLSTMGVKICADLQEYDLRKLQKEFGPKTGQSLHQFCRGIDNRPIRVEQERKSVSAEINYGIRFTEDSDAEKFIGELSEEVQKRLSNINMKGKTITLKVKVRKAGAPVDPAKFMGHGVCDNLAKSVTLVTPTDSVQVITRECLVLLRQMKIPAHELRGIGIQVNKLSSTKPGVHAERSVLDFIKSMPKASSSKEIVTDMQSVPSTGDMPSTSKERDTDKHNMPSTSHSEDKDKFTTPKPKQGIRAMMEKSSSARPASSSTMVTNDGASTSSAAIATREDEDLYLPSPSQVDPSVLAALPENLRHQILQGYASKNQQIPQRKVVSKEQNIPSDWDVSVLQALPAEVVKDLLLTELEEKTVSGEMNQQTIKHEPTPARWINDEGAGPSGVNLKKEKEGRIGEDSISALPSFSQIDPSCLEALPSELQEELKHAYREQEKKGVAKPPDHTEGSKVKLSPLKLKSPKKGPKKKGSPGRAVRGPGRPRKTSPQKQRLDWKHKQRNIQNMFMGASVMVDSHHGNRDDATENVKDSGNRDEAVVGTICQTESRDNDPESIPTQETTQPDPEKTVNLCGRVELKDVKLLLGEWIESCITPEDEDVEQFVQYLSDLVDDKNLEMVDLLLKYMRRMVAQSNQKQWTDSYSAIVNRVQGLIKSVYGSQLKIT
ncbi:DNA repair protein REV1-like isoform X2 [Ptychodera flava]|uniref:DNA repair protein REV1-like isoform X2 n=1 Tax=Ptychodera flava TaxID=63121 RepID=UPI00396AA956